MRITKFSMKSGVISRYRIRSFDRHARLGKLHPCTGKCRIEASPHGFLILCRTVRPSFLEVYDGEAPSPIEKARHHSLKASPEERTKHLGRLFGVGLPSEFRLFVHRVRRGTGRS